MKNRIQVPTIIFFVIAIFVILYVSPREAGYKYSYSINKPWQYGLLTAPFKFYVHKSDSQIKIEKDSILSSFQPYFYTDASAKTKSILEFENEAKNVNLPKKYISFLEKQFTKIYKVGIISKEDLDKTKNSNSQYIHLRNEDNITGLRMLTYFYTPKSAYESIINNVPAFLNKSKLNQIQINNFLQINILFDDKISTSIKNNLLQEITLYEGEIQLGEKIINRGEIVTPHIKNILDSYTKEIEGKSSLRANPIWLLFGKLIMISLLISALTIYLILYRPEEYKNRKNAIFILLMVLIPAIITGIMASAKMYTLIYLIPFAIPTILVRTFIDSRTSMTTHTITIILCGLMIPFQQMSQFIVLQILVGFMCVFILRNLSERSQLIQSSLFVLITYVIGYTGWQLCTEGNIIQLRESGRLYLYFTINFIFVNFSYLLVYICEKVFGFICDVTMVELSNTNRPLLQKLSEVAPGTFQHSIQVSTLAFSAAHEIGANAALVRTGALYHDIGKMTNPIFFTENQTAGMNPHANLSEKESAHLIINHIPEGIKIAKKYNLPQQIIDFIETHHGLGMAKYFYTSYKNKYPDDKIDETDFTYPGPNPFTKETALLMMADGVEAASRSMKDYTQESITSIVNKIIDNLVNDGLLKNAPITFRDIEITKNVFIEKLISIYHIRVAYPELNRKS